MSNEFGQEVVALHRFFADWLSGRVDQSAPAFARLSQALAPDFQIVFPSGERMVRAQLLDMLWSAHGVNGETFTIEIRALESTRVTEDIALVLYQEWQMGEPVTARLSSALLERRQGKLVWRHVHETWLPDAYD